MPPDALLMAELSALLPWALPQVELAEQVQGLPQEAGFSALAPAPLPVPNAAKPRPLGRARHLLLAGPD